MHEDEIAEYQSWFRALSSTEEFSFIVQALLEFLPEEGKEKSEAEVTQERVKVLQK